MSSLSTLSTSTLLGPLGGMWIVVLLAGGLVQPVRAQCTASFDLHLEAPEGQADDSFFGASMDAVGRTLVVGQATSYREYRKRGSGRVLVYAWSRGRWRLRQEILPPDARPAMSFGAALALDEAGDRLVIGAPAADHLCPDEPRCDSGAVYVYQKVAGEFRLRARLLSKDGVEGAWLGASVGLQGDRVLAGAPRQDGSVSQTGAVYVWQEIGAQWVEVQKLSPSSLATGDRFGAALAADLPWLVVGAPGVDHGGLFSGSAFVFQHDGSRFRRTDRLDNDLPGSLAFANAVEIDGGVIVVSNPTTAPGPTNCNAYAFDGTAWNKFQDLDQFVSGRTGRSFVLRGRNLLFGADGWVESGEALLLRRAGGRFEPILRLSPEDASWQQHFVGETVALGEDEEGRTLIIAGAPNAARWDGTGRRVGLCFSFLEPPLLLSVQPTRVKAGSDLEMRACGARARSRGLFAIVSIDGSPTFQPFAADIASGRGMLEHDARVPPGLEGRNLRFAALGLDERGRVQLSNRVKVKFR